MIKDFIIIDDVFDNPYELISIAKHIPLYTKENYVLSREPDDSNMPEGEWRGHRSKPFHLYDKDTFTSSFNEIIKKVFDGFFFYYEITSYFHFLTEKEKFNQSWWHKDGDFVFAGIVYLNKETPPNGGTILKINDENVFIKNKFNRLVFYKANILHTVENTFGNDINNSRMTLNFFVNKMFLKNKESSSTEANFTMTG